MMECGGVGGGGGGMTLAAPGAAAIPAGAVAAAADEVVRRVRPTEASERRRAEVVGYARRLVGATLGCEVFAYGSVPLKTYLPDGDVDLTVLGNTSYGSTLIDDIYYILQSEEQNGDSEFEVKDLQLINAEVRLIKCTIENIVVDISFNQTGGICTLCFLELVDRKVGKNHLLKRSIILIKAWCYYESRLLGAHHGLISTYALETLILYIFNLFHKSLHGPLEVLYRFLEYFSKFDWDNYCISLNGPVALSSLPNQIVEATNTPSGDLLFDKEFLKNTVQRTSPKDSNACYTKFRAKCLNIIDPLKEHNNLGRSVNRASFNRIRTAFSYGAQKLGKVLLLQSELIPDEIYGFFKNTLNRIGSGVRPDIGYETYDDAFQYEPFLGTGKALWEEMSSMKISCKNQQENRSPHPLSKSLVNDDSYGTLNAPTHLAGYFHGDHMVASSTDLNLKLPCVFHHTPKQHPSFSLENGNGGSEQYMHHEMAEQVSCWTAETCHVNEKPLMHPQVHSNNTFYSNLISNLEYFKSGPSDMITVAHGERQNFPPFPLNLVDLSGDLDLHLRCLRQVQYHLEYMFDGFLQSVQEASSDCKVVKELFDIPTLNIESNTDVLLPGLLSPSSNETDERRLSPVSSSHSTEDFSQQSQDGGNWGVACQLNVLSPSETIAPSNGLSPRSSNTDSENSVQWYHSSDETVPHILQKHMSSLGENSKTQISRPVRVKSNQASVSKRKFVTCKEQLAKETATKDINLSQVQDSEREYIGTNKNIAGYSCDTCIRYIKPESEGRQIPRHYKHVRSSKSSFENTIYDSDMGFARSSSAMNQVPKYQPLKVQDMSNECIYPTRSLTKNQSYDVRKELEIFNWPRKQMPIVPLKLQNSLRGRAGSNKKLTTKQINNNHKERLSFVRDSEQIPENQANSNKEPEIVGKYRRLLPRVQLSHHNDKSHTMLASSTCQPSCPVTEGYSQSGNLEIPPLEAIEFGTLGPFSITLVSPKLNKVPNRVSTSKTSTDAAALTLQSHPTQSRSPGFYKVGDEEHFPHLRAGTH